jgi:cytosine/adenosine deaminase-related metal-dependent hydrolase
MIRPGLVNAHTHLYSALAPLGMPAPARAPENFVQILERVWWRLDRALDARALRASARLYVAEALLAGTTGLIDHHESPSFIEGSLDVLADACQELGVRAVLCFGATERNGGRDEARRGLAECRRFVRENRRPLVRGVVALHASFTVSDDTMREAGALCRELGTVLHVHVAEDEADMTDARARGHAGPLQRLLALDALPPGSILAHGVWLTDADVRLAAERGLWLVQNPRSNEHNRVGYAGALVESARVALGTDGYPADMREEAVHLWRLAREHHDRASDAALDARMEAGRALLAERFAPESPAADRIVLLPASPGHRPGVTTVTVAGREVVEDGRLQTGDLDAIRAEARAEAPALWHRMEAIAWPD